MRHGSIPSRTVERLVLYKRLLTDSRERGVKNLFSHQLAVLAHNTAAQVRRDIMTIGYEGSPHQGYSIEDLIGRIDSILEGTGQRSAVLIGVGALGRALLSFFTTRSQGITITAAFDSDETRTGRVICGCRCFPAAEFAERLAENSAQVGIIAVPEADAQKAADLMIASGIRAILNFAPVPLKTPDDVCVERMDISGALEKLAYFAEHGK